MQYRLRTLLLFVTIAASFCGYVHLYRTKTATTQHFETKIHLYRNEWEKIIFGPAQKIDNWWCGELEVPIALPAYDKK